MLQYLELLLRHWSVEVERMASHINVRENRQSGALPLAIRHATEEMAPYPRGRPAQRDHVLCRAFLHLDLTPR
jgi:hypothetical protein